MALPNHAASGSPATLQPEVTQPAAQDRTEDVTEAAPPALATVSNVLGTGEGTPRLPQELASPVVDAAARNQDAVPKRSSGVPNRSERKSDANVSKPSAGNTPDAPAQQFAIGDAAGSKTQEAAQPAPATAAHDGQDKPGTPTSAVLPQAASVGASTVNDEGVRPQIAFQSAASSPAQNPEADPVVIQSARVLERMGQSEMRVGLNSSDFGSIELHTRVNQDQVGASIATSHTELRAAMMAEMPSLEHAIAQHQLKLDSFNLDSRAGAQHNHSGAAAGSQSGSSRSWAQSGPEVSEFNDDTAAQETSLPQAWTSPHSSGLNVHA